METSCFFLEIKHENTLKSDHCGMETYTHRHYIHHLTELKSDHCGMETFIVLFWNPQVPSQLKSDHCGMETLEVGIK